MHCEPHNNAFPTEPERIMISDYENPSSDLHWSWNCGAVLLHTGEWQSDTPALMWWIRWTGSSIILISPAKNCWRQLLYEVASLLPPQSCVLVEEAPSPALLKSETKRQLLHRMGAIRLCGPRFQDSFKNSNKPEGKGGGLHWQLVHTMDQPGRWSLHKVWTSLGA